MIINRYKRPSLWGPSWPGAEFVRGRDVQLPFLVVFMSGADQRLHLLDEHILDVLKYSRSRLSQFFERAFVINVF